MPAFLIHWHVLIETARSSQDAGSDLGSLIIDTAALRRRSYGLDTPPQTTPAGAVWDTGPLPEIDYRFPGSDISAMAYLGALAPDMTYYTAGNFKDKLTDRRLQRSSVQPPANNNAPWADLLHNNRSGDVLLAFLEFIADVPSPALRSQALAFSMGYLSHIATDIALNPYINALAAAYHRSEVPGMGVFNPLGPHFYVELCLDEYIASVYFHHPLYVWTNQPWWQYIEPAAQSISAGATLSARVLDLLAAAAEAIYGLSEEQAKTFHLDHLAGLRGLRRYLAGRGGFRFLIWRLITRRRAGNPFTAIITAGHDQQGSFEEVLAYAIRLSERLCRRAMSYYASLRNVNAEANERSRKRAILHDDLRNWRLDTGYASDITFDQDVTLHLLHNWVHFAELWEPDAAPTNQPQASLNH
jgi:hypothetical protein